MKISGSARALLAAAAVCSAPLAASAAPRYDGSTPLLCAPTTVSECTPDGACKRVSAEAVNLPQFLKIDVKAQKVYSEETGRASPSRNIEHLSGQLILQGGQDGRGWTMTVSEETGRMSATITTEGEGFVVFGACTTVQ
ncbi:MAG TPA: hypothetical protein VEL75_10650 [Candidatus Methylomirabilis sp.]|nr:hypothetical protein [Candidatus Methylomirabilis sp.]